MTSALEGPGSPSNIAWDRFPSCAISLVAIALRPSYWPYLG